MSQEDRGPRLPDKPKMKTRTCYLCNQVVTAPLLRRVLPMMDLPDVTSDVTTWKCPRCGDMSMTYRAIGPLHEAVRAELEKKPGPLTEAEFKFCGRASGLPVSARAKPMRAQFARVDGTWKRIA